MPDYINNHGHTVYLNGPDGVSVAIAPLVKITLPEYFDRYCDKGFIKRVIATVNQQQPTRRVKVIAKARPQVQAQLSVARTQARPLAQRPTRPPPTTHPPPIQKSISHDKRLGRVTGEDAKQLLAANLQADNYPISNNIGVGILSYNRPHALRRLVESIQRFTDLNKTTVFISDDGSANTELLAYLEGLQRTIGFVVLRKQERLGIAGNTNRLLRCLRRFAHILLLNDDAEVKTAGWEHLYPTAAGRTGLRHFCMRQPGVYGARPGDPVTINGVALTKVDDKPHGAVLYLDASLLDAIGYFDENRFGYYGMEHVDWSTRAQSAQKVQGFFDVADSQNYFAIHNDASAVESRVELLAAGRQAFAGCRPDRGYVAPAARSEVAKISYVIPCRNHDRNDAIATVILGVKAQRYPQIDIIVSEHDVAQHSYQRAKPFTGILAPSGGLAFNKSKAFNTGVALATSEHMVLHDADIIPPSGYTTYVADILGRHEACHLGKSVIYTSPAGRDQANAGGPVCVSTECTHVVGYFEGGSLACHRRIYWAVGGFCEQFFGYGCEDCEFYDRLSRRSKWVREAKFDFLHLHHGRCGEWRDQHKENKLLAGRLMAQPLEQRVSDQRAALLAAGYGKNFQ